MNNKQLIAGLLIVTVTAAGSWYGINLLTPNTEEITDEPSEPSEPQQLEIEGMLTIENVEETENGFVQVTVGNVGNQSIQTSDLELTEAATRDSLNCIESGEELEAESSLTCETDREYPSEELRILIEHDGRPVTEVVVN